MSLINIWNAPCPHVVYILVQWMRREKISGLKKLRLLNRYWMNEINGFIKDFKVDLRQNKEFDFMNQEVNFLTSKLKGIENLHVNNHYLVNQMVLIEPFEKIAILNTNLKKLSIEIAFDGCLIKELANVLLEFKHLDSIYIKFIYLEDNTSLDLTTIAHLKNLDHLAVVYSNVNLYGLSTLVSLRKLDLPITDTCASQIFTLTNLKDLNLSACWSLYDKDFKNISMLKSLTRLDISECHNLSGNVLGYLNNLENLKYLDISGNFYINDQALMKMSSIRNLFIVVSFCDNVSNELIKTLSNEPYCWVIKRDSYN